jgi:hypothetical protein
MLHRMELLFVLLFRYIRQIRQEQLQKFAARASERARKMSPTLLK